MHWRALVCKPRTVAWVAALCLGVGLVACQPPPAPPPPPPEPEPLVVSPVPPPPAEPAPPTVKHLRVLSARDPAITSEVASRFEREFSISLQIETLRDATNLSERLALGEEWDLLIVDEHVLPALIASNHLAELDRIQLPAFRTLSRRFLAAPYDVGNRFTVPFTWSATGLLFRRDCGPAPASWNALFDASASSTPCAPALLDNPVHATAAALIRGGHSPNSTEDATLSEAFEAMAPLAARPHGLLNPPLAAAVATGLVGVAQAWNWEAVLGLPTNLTFAFPREGTLLALDCLAIPRTTLKAEAAHRLIAFLIRPEIAAELAQNTGRMTCSEAARSLVLDRVRQSPGFDVPRDVPIFRQDPLPRSGLVRHWRQLTSSSLTNAARWEEPLDTSEVAPLPPAR